jgi:hypothetical protein
MMIGRTDERSMPRFATARELEAVSLFGSRSRNPSGPAVLCRTTKAGHMTASEPTLSAAQPLEPQGPSTHANPVRSGWLGGGRNSDLERPV